MNKICLLLMVLFICGLSCNKELNRKEKDENKPHVTVIVQSTDENGDGDDDGHSGGNGNNPDTTNNNGNPGTGDESGNEISQSEINEHAVYTFMGVSGVYFGCTSTFKTGKESLEFIFGTNMTTNLKFTQPEFEALIHPGTRQYGSLGAFTSFPERYSDKVEIAYTDKNGRRWCSTWITEKKTSNGVVTDVKIDQTQSQFTIDNIHKIEIAAEQEGYRVNGHFACTLYEVNGKAKKKIKGDFTGVVAPR